MKITVLYSYLTDKYFFSTDHCQKTRSDFIPITYSVPHTVQPRPSLPNGIVKSKKDVIAVYYSAKKEIPNPDPDYQA